MKSSDVFPSKYLKAADLDEDVELTIRSVILEDIQTEGGLEQKAIVYFEQGEKGLLLNKTNWNALATQFGDESDEWIGKGIVLTVMEVQFKDKMVPALRIKTPRSPTGRSPFVKKATVTPVEKSWPGEFVVALLKAKVAANAAQAVTLLNQSGLSEDISAQEAVEIIKAMQAN